MIKIGTKTAGKRLRPIYVFLQLFVLELEAKGNKTSNLASNLA